MIGAFSHSTGNYYAALWLLSGCLAIAAVNAALVSEQWAAKFSLKKPHTSHSHSVMDHTWGRTGSFPVGDAGMLTGMGEFLDSDSESACGEVVGKKACQCSTVVENSADMEMGLSGAAADTAAASDGKAFQK